MDHGTGTEELPMPDDIKNAGVIPHYKYGGCRDRCPGSPPRQYPDYKTEHDAETPDR